ncbi:MAG: ATP-dependent Clp protease adaptor ClpS, partial [Ktedonobacteraceae bacterium]
MVESMSILTFYWEPQRKGDRKGPHPTLHHPRPYEDDGSFPKNRPARGSLPSSPVGPFSTRLVISRSLVYNSVRGFVLYIFTTIITGVCLNMSNTQLIPSQSQVDTEALLRLRTRLLPPYSVVLHDDDYNEMNYVIFVLLHAINNLSQ